MNQILLSADEVRVLGALMEKRITTPEYYPLSLNALTNACNQKSNRDPVMSYNDVDMARLVDGLRDKRLVAMVTGASATVSRVPKYRELFSETIGLDEKGMALMCELMVRGPQTAAQLRSRGERLHTFADLAEVDATLRDLMSREFPLIAKMPRQPGFKEGRYAHLLCGAPPVSTEPLAPTPEPAMIEVHAEKERMARLETEITALRTDINDLRMQFEELKRQLGGVNTPPPGTEARPPVV